MRSLLLAAIASVGLVGCVGGFDMPNSPPPGGSGSGSGSGDGTNPSPVPPAQSLAKPMFDRDVYPIIAKDHSLAASGCASGAGASCHNTAGATPTMFVADDPSQGYATATSYQSVVGNFTESSAGLLTKITNGHQGRTYSTAEKKLITDWLAQEVIERNGGGGGGSGSGSGSGTTESPSQVTARLLNNWSACMSLTNWQQANMTTAWGRMQTNNGSKCESCHATGGQGMIATEIEESGPSGPGMWTVVSTNQYYMIQFFTVDNPIDPANAKIIINHVSFDGVANGVAPHTEHPRFNATTNNGMTALQSLYDLTNTAITAGNCGPTKLNPPAQ